MPIKLPSFRPRRDDYPPDLWTKCPTCGDMLFNKQLEKADRICPNCDHHFRLSAAARLDLLLDPGTFRERDAGLQSVDPLGFVDQKPYPERVTTAQAQTGLRDAAVRGTGAIEGQAVSICVMDFGFMGGSMGAVVGEKVARAAEDAIIDGVPLIIVSASGGARMQEGTLALMQLAKTVAVLERVRLARVPFISVMSDPTTGGVFASYAVLGDVNLAEPNALIGFAGARVAAGTIAQELPPGFQRSEFLFDHGFIDRVVHRRALRGELASLLRFMRVPEPSATDTRSAFSPIGSFLSSMVSAGSAAVGSAAGVATGGLVGTLPGAPVEESTEAEPGPGPGSGGNGSTPGDGAGRSSGSAPAGTPSPAGPAAPSPAAPAGGGERDG